MTGKVCAKEYICNQEVRGQANALAARAENVRSVGVDYTTSPHYAEYMQKLDGINKGLKDATELLLKCVETADV